MQKSPMCVPAPSGIRSWLSPAMHFGVVSDSCELLLSALPCRTAAIAAAASAATWAKPCSIFTRRLVDVAKSKKGPLLVFLSLFFDLSHLPKKGDFTLFLKYN